MFYNQKPDEIVIRRGRIPQFCILPFEFCILKLAIGQFELL